MFDPKIMEKLANLKKSKELQEKESGTYIETTPPPKVIPTPSKSKPFNSNTGRYTNEKELGEAIAPYNFIPLNHKVVPAQFGKDGLGNFIKEQGNYSGVINYEIETLTPTFIRGVDSEFFSPAGITKIPGSSMRGMVSNLIKIAGFGSMVPGEDIQDTVLYYRSFADLCRPYRDYYMNNIRTEKTENGKTHSEIHANAGYMVKDDERYYIIPAQQKANKGYGRERIPNGLQEKEAGPRWRKNDVLMISGYMHNKKWKNFIYPPDMQKEKTEVLEVDIEGYRYDVSRKGFDVLTYLDDEKVQQRLKNENHSYLKGILGAIVPCFYVQWQDQQGRNRVSFGNTTYFRLAYKQSVGEHVPSGIRDKEQIDISSGIFGKKGQFASRVFFEDADLQNTDQQAMTAIYLKPLLSPKTTTFQHYLEQGHVKNISNLKHWDADQGAERTALRGYKLYWHRKTTQADWEGSADKIISGAKRVSPLKPGAKFKGCIRFEQLSNVELGALLFALDLPTGCAHKLGMGKPLGFGSVRMNISLEERCQQTRYTQMFGSNGWSTGMDAKATQPFKQEFEKYVLSHLGSGKTLTSLWEHERLRELHYMLDWTLTGVDGWKDKTRYMEIERPTGKTDGKGRLGKNNEYRERAVLPRPAAVVKGFK